MKVRELLDIKEGTLASAIEASVNELSDKTNKYRQLKSVAALRALQKTQEKLISKLQSKAA